MVLIADLTCHPVPAFHRQQNDDNIILSFTQNNSLATVYTIHVCVHLFFCWRTQLSATTIIIMRICQNLYIYLNLFCAARHITWQACRLRKITGLKLILFKSIECVTCCWNSYTLNVTLGIAYVHRICSQYSPLNMCEFPRLLFQQSTLVTNVSVITSYNLNLQLNNYINCILHINLER